MICRSTRSVKEKIWPIIFSQSLWSFYSSYFVLNSNDAIDSIQGLTHIKRRNNEMLVPRMVDVSQKNQTFRTATAMGFVELPKKIVEGLQLRDPNSKQLEIMAEKGPVISTSIVAGVMALKKTADLIPFCHSIPVEGCDISVDLRDGPSGTQVFEIRCSVKTSGKTGVEMEALVGVSATALCIYDMLKALSHEMKITDIHLVSKKGGKSDFIATTPY